MAEPDPLDALVVADPNVALQRQQAGASRPSDARTSPSQAQLPGPDCSEQTDNGSDHDEDESPQDPR